MDFSKRDRKDMRVLIYIGLEREYKTGLERVEAVLQDWREKQPESNREHYSKMYGTVRDFDKHIARRYDGLSGSSYFIVVLDLLREGILEHHELEIMKPETRAWFEERTSRDE